MVSVVTGNQYHHNTNDFIHVPCECWLCFCEQEYIITLMMYLAQLFQEEMMAPQQDARSP